jgi:hypothetical protein
MEPLTRLCSSGRRSPYTIRFNRVSCCRDFAVKFFADRGISLLGSFLVPLFPASPNASFPANTGSG